MLDILIQGGTVIDGTGRERFSADVGIKDGVIYEIGELSHEDAKKTIDAKGKMVTPGFVDVCNHSDTYWTLFTNPLQESLICQGVTTIIGGNCGSSLAPLLSEEAILSIRKWSAADHFNIDWRTMEEFLQTVSQKESSVNFGTLIGHGTLRRALARDESRQLNEEEEKILVRAVEDAMHQGAFGLSSGLVYTHEANSDRREMRLLAKAMHDLSGVYATHIRNETSLFREAVREALRIAAETGVRTHISHLKVLGQFYWDAFEEALEEIREEVRVGSEVTFDIFPYTATGSVLYTLLPEWASHGGKHMMLARIREKSSRREIVEGLRRKQLDYSRIRVAFEKGGGHKTIEEMAEKQGIDSEEVILNLLSANEGRVIAFLDLISEQNLCAGLRSKYSIVASDGAGYSLAHKKTGEHIHPRNFGAFPRVLGKYVREEKVLTWEEGIYKMSGLPARTFDMRNRGELRVGYAADVVVFDPETIKDEATFEDPYRHPTGIEHVLVNGKCAFTDHAFSEERFGEVIKKR